MNNTKSKRAEKALGLLLTLAMLFNMFAGIVPAAFAVSGDSAESNTQAVTAQAPRRINLRKAPTTVSGIAYVDEDGANQTCTSATTVDDTDFTWGDDGNDGWYVLNTDVDFTNGRDDTNGITVSGDVKLILCDGCTLTVIGDDTENAEKAGITVTGIGNSLTIYGQTAQSGKLYATGIENGAGIGGGNMEDGNNITINGGEIHAAGGTYGAGIGGGNEGGGDDITINGGTVYATSAGSSAGIGGGNEGGADGITVNGGKIYASSSGQGAGIGGGGGGSGKNIKICGGYIEAFSTNMGAGIGGGYNPSECSVEISGGEVHATGGTGGAGIGAGENSLGNVSVTISGGTVYAEGVTGIGAGIFESEPDSVCAVSISITGGNVTASGNGDGTQGIGVGTVITKCTVNVTIDEDSIVKADDATPITTNAIAHTSDGNIYSEQSFKKRYITVVTPVLPIEVDTESELTAALTNVKKGEIIKLTDDIQLTDAMSVGADKDFSLDLNGNKLKYEGADKNPVISNAGKLTVIDSRSADASTTRYWMPNTDTSDSIPDGLWQEVTADDIEGLTLNSDYFTTVGGVITGGTGNKSNGNGGGIYNTGTLVLTDGNIVGNTANEKCGGGVSNNGSSDTDRAKMTMTGGYIAGNTADQGGGIFDNSFSELVFEDGKISYNTAYTEGGGINAAYREQADVTFTMTGGEVSYNYAQGNAGGINRKCATVMTGGKVINNVTDGKCGGVPYNNGDSFSLGGDVVISGNISTEGIVHDSNLCVKQNRILTLCDGGNGTTPLTDEAKIGITIYKYDSATKTNEDIAGVFTGAYKTDYSYAFFPDSEGYYLIYNPSKKLALVGREASVTFDGSTVDYGSIETALAAVNALDECVDADHTATIKLLDNAAVEIPLLVDSGKFVELDLNGKVLKFSFLDGTSDYDRRSVLINRGNLTIIDSKASDSRTTRYWVPNTNDSDTIPNGVWECKATKPANTAKLGTDYFVTVGGVITGGRGGSTSVRTDHPDGNRYAGGIYNSGTLVINNGNIVGNYAEHFGGGIVNEGSFTFNSGCISGNYTYQYGGGIENISDTASTLIAGGVLSYNAAGLCGGAVDNYGKGTVTVTAGTFCITPFQPAAAAVSAATAAAAVPAVRSTFRAEISSTTAVRRQAADFTPVWVP